MVYQIAIFLFNNQNVFLMSGRRSIKISNMSKERLQEIAKELANNANMPYCWEDVYNRLISGYPLPFKVDVK